MSGALRYIEPSLMNPEPGRFETPYYAAYTNSGDLGAATYANDGQKVRLVDPKTGSVLYEGTGPDGAKMATGYANALSQDNGRKAAWAIQIGNGDDWTTTGADSKDSRSLLGKIGHTIGKVAPVLALGALGAATGGIGLAALGGLAGLGAAGKLGGKGGSGGSSLGIDQTLGTPESLSDTFRAQLPEPTVGRTRVPIPAGTDLTTYGMGPERQFFVRPPAPPPPAEAPHMARGGSFAVKGAGDGRSDGVQANLSDGEYVVDAETVAMLGNGSNNAGADRLDRMRVNVRRHKGRGLAKGRFSVNAKAPEHYMEGR